MDVEGYVCWLLLIGILYGGMYVYVSWYEVGDMVGCGRIYMVVLNKDGIGVGIGVLILWVVVYGVY